MIRAVLPWLVSFAVLGAPPARGAAVKHWSVSTAERFDAGSLDGTLVDEKGQVRLAPALDTLWGPDTGIVWALAPDGVDAAFAALSSPARVIRVEHGVEEPEVWFAPEEEALVTAVESDGVGGVFFGVSPGGALYHAAAAGQATIVADTEAGFVWAVARASDGSVWIGTGTPGKLLRHRDGEAPEVVADLGDDPVRSIVALPDGGVLLGSGGRGRLIRVDPDGRSFVLLDADEPEIVGVVMGDDGEIFALAAQGPRQLAKSDRPASAQTAATETVRVVATAPPAAEGAPTQPKQPDTRPAPRKPRIAAVPGAVLYRLQPDGGTQKIWQRAGEIAFGLVRRPDGRLIVATGNRGRLYLLDRRGRSGRLIEFGSEQASAMALGRDGRVFVGGTTDARVGLLHSGGREQGVYMSSPVDAGSVADWGRLSWHGELPRGAKMDIAIRAGNTGDPDDTWTRFVPVGSGAENAVETSLPATRWAQVLVRMRSSRSGESPALRRLALAYRPHNRRPSIQSLEVQPAGVVWSRNPVPAGRTAGPLVADDPVARSTAATLRPKGQNGAVRKAYELGVRTFSWKGRDPDGDRIVYRLGIRREGTEHWVPLARGLQETFVSWDTRGMPDGLYRARLRAVDSVDNPDGTELDDQLEGELFRIDNTRPSLATPKIQRADGGYRVEFIARDPGGSIAAVEAAVDGGPWLPLEPLDGIADSDEETYHWTFREAQAADEPRSLRIRVTDSSGNLGGGGWPLDER